MSDRICKNCRLRIADNAKTCLFCGRVLTKESDNVLVNMYPAIFHKTRMAKPNTTYGYLKKVIDDYLGQGIYTTVDFRRKQDQKRQAEHREIPNIPVFKID